MDWINRYTQQCYTPVGVADIYSMDVSGVVWGAEARTYKPRSRNLVYTFERISDAPCAAPPTPRSH